VTLTDRRRRRRLRALVRWDRRIRAEGDRLLAGVDEVGVGPLAGPVVAAAVVLPDEPVVLDVDDSKVVPRGRREKLAAEIRRVALDVSVGVVDVEEIETLNVYHAGIEAMRRAVLGLGAAVDRVLVDARTIPGLAVAQTAVVHGDRLSYAIAAASIVAKVHRDSLMAALAERHPGYGFDRHAGYATADHREAIRRLGPCAAHRRTFQLV
jgi:ribonuclease HII